MPGKLGPHELVEVQLMLEGKKEVAYFCYDYPDDYINEVKAHIKNGDFESLTFGPNNLIIWVKGAQDKALRLKELVEYSHQNGFIEKVEREIGEILGYTKKEIDFYIQNLKKQHLLKRKTSK